MEKLLASILLVVYFTVSTGFVVSVHYCMNKVDSVVLGDNHGDECGKCGMVIADSMGCCKNDVKVVKLKLDQAFAKLAVPDFSLSAVLPVRRDEFDFIKRSPEEQTYPLANGPPLSRQDTYLQNCVFRL